MNDIPPLHVAQILKQYGLRATKSLGQNFLQDAGALQTIAQAAEIEKDDTVLEIGPGLGSLTRYLSVRSRQVVAVELDRKFAPVLRTVLRPYRNVRVIEGDILSLSPLDLHLPQKYVVTANIPYNITSALLRHLLSSDPRPRRIVLTIQKEVAERICSAPPDMSLLSLSVQVYGEPSIIATIPAAAFYPAPHVDSAVVRIDILPSPRIEAAVLPVAFQLMKAGFLHKRKTLRNSLSAGLGIPTPEASALLTSARLDPHRRAETLSLNEWEALSRLWAAKDRPRPPRSAY